MGRIAVASILIAVSFSMGACIKGEQASKANQSGQKTAHGRTDDKNAADNGIVDVVKGKLLVDFPAYSIGQAFDGYAFFDKKEWQETRTSAGKIYVDFFGWYKSPQVGFSVEKSEVSVRGIQIKFAIYPDGSFGVVMASKIIKNHDGTDSYEPLSDSKGILAKIYSNKEISF